MSISASSLGHLVRRVYSDYLVRYETDQMDQADLRSRHFFRVAMGVDVLARLQQQIQQVLGSLREVRQGKAK